MVSQHIRASENNTQAIQEKPQAKPPPPGSTYHSSITGIKTALTVVETGGPWPVSYTHLTLPTILRV